MKNPTLPPLWPTLLLALALTATNILVQWQVSFYKFTVTMGFFVYPLTFLITDYVSEVYGKYKCHRMVLICLVFTFIPSVAMSTLQITIGSLLAYWVAQYHDIWAFDWWKKKTQGKHLWLRNNASTIVSQAMDTIIFSFVCFIGVLPKQEIFKIIYSEYPLKIIYALADTAPLYLALAIRNKFVNTKNQ